MCLSSRWVLVGFAVVASGPASPQSSAPTRPLKPPPVRAAAPHVAHGVWGPSGPEVWGFLVCKVPVQPQGPLCLPSSLQPSRGFVCPGAYPPGEQNPPLGSFPRGLGVPRGTKAAETAAHPGVSLLLAAFGGRTPTRGGAHTRTRVARSPRGAPVPHGCPAGPLFCSVRHGCAGT